MLSLIILHHCLQICFSFMLLFLHIIVCLKYSFILVEVYHYSVWPENTYTISLCLGSIFSKEPAAALKSLLHLGIRETTNFLSQSKIKVLEYLLTIVNYELSSQDLRDGIIMSAFKNNNTGAKLYNKFDFNWKIILGLFNQFVHCKHLFLLNFHGH